MQGLRVGPFWSSGDDVRVIMRDSPSIGFNGLKRGIKNIEGMGEAWILMSKGMVILVTGKDCGVSKRE